MCAGVRRPWQGRSAGVHFEWPKWTKSHLGRSPPKDLPGVRGWNCVKPRFGPSPLLWLLVLPLRQAILAAGPITRRFLCPGLLWRSGVPAAESQASDSWEQRHSRIRPWG